MQHRLAEILHGIDDEVRIFDGYSGRSMYGEETTGIIVPSTGYLMQVMLEAAEEIAEAQQNGEISAREEFRIDDIGFDTIVY